MEEPKISEMWADLKQAEALPKGGVLSSCEPELQELMRQIDGMVQSKRLEWERERQTLQARLEVRQQEYNIQRATLQQKHTEVGQLRAQVEVLQKNSREASSQYEIQLSSVRTEVDNMKKEYEKLHKRYNQRREKLTKANQNEAAAADSKVAHENRKLTAKLEDYKRKVEDSAQEKRLLQHQIDSLESQSKMLEEKLSLSQQQSSSYQSQLDRRKEMLDSAEINMKSQVAQLESQLQRARDMINSQDTQLSRLRASYDEAIKSQRHALEEKEEVETELRKAQQASLRLEEELNNIQMNSSAKEEVLRRTQIDMKRLNMQVNQLQDQLTEKDSLGSLESHAHHDEKHSVLQEELKNSKTQLKLLKKSEQSLQQEVVELKEQLDHLKGECVLLNKQLGSKITDMKKLEKAETQKLKQEILQLQNELCEAKGCHQGEVEAMRHEIQCTSKQAQQKSLALASSVEKVKHLEKLLKQKTETLERKEAEMKVTTAQLDAFRLENRHLRRSALNMSSAVGSNRSLNETLDVVETEAHMKELQSAYNASLGTLESQNSKLSIELMTLRKQLLDADRNSRREAAAREAKERHTSPPARRAENLSQSYEEKIEELQSQVSVLERELDSRNSSLSRIGLEHEALAEFVSGVETVVRQPDVSQYNGSMMTTDEDMADSTEVATTNFLAEQDRRTAELERRLNSHIQDLKIATESSL
ncbi:hypothetical protein CAPTEDRAFT_227992 [Capitella teleta]|uniref:Uncharacterized protein n=1 Tax=Capitella teleta TaxID=283909 RepID=R7TQU3_CAPTE|nr:hypothetical protein CAPTEDRAFT_227992 [Capitella teleta]|eukprot:ELT96034.1 hypothetical protein CAPTEDRAFT_227992 [Capitella teleta]